MMMTGT
jgi:hypothetical protein